MLLIFTWWIVFDTNSLNKKDHTQTNGPVKLGLETIYFPVYHFISGQIGLWKYV